VRVIVAQGEVDLVRHNTQAVQLRLVSQPERALTGRIVREVPAGQDQLPSRAFSTQGGGAVVADPRDRDGMRSLQRSFQFDIELPATEKRGAPALFGSRVFVRFEHAAAPLAAQWYRSLRQIFLSRFHA
jgi:putative peptide zinc metalloprotease protein